MTKSLYLLTIGLLMNFCSLAAPGDTTWVQANTTDLDNYGAYDAKVGFPVPGKSYRQIYMIFTLGKHPCASSVCGDWDYTVQNFVMLPGGESFELGRLITPYANVAGPRTPFTWKQRYVFDVTDYAPVLHDSATMRIFYSGYSGGFTGDIKFAFIEGGPDREVVAVKRLWNGSFGYGGATSINVNFNDMLIPVPASTKSAEVKFTVTGHGSDANGCCEFLSKNYQVKFDGHAISNTPIWREDCGFNELFPQTGTWIYNRANWCPGAIVKSNTHPLPPISAGNSINVGLQFDPYSGGGSYTTETHLFFYGAMKKILDASIDQIIAPSNDENHYRANPICGSPVIRVKNRGAAAVNSMTFEYGMSDSSMQSYTWTGKLNTFEEADIALPELKKLTAISGDTGKFKFTARIVYVNGSPDADKLNNAMSTQFVSAPLWPSSFRIVLNTNNEGTLAAPATSETSWIIYDMQDNIVKQRTNAKVSTFYTDTISLPTGCYRLQVYDSSCNGLSWWANPSTVTDGAFFVRRLATTANIPVNGYVYTGQFAHDFGCGITQFFTINTPVPAGVTELSANDMSIEAYPNPARSIVNVDIAGMEHISGTIQVVDALGRVVAATPCSDAHNQVNIDGFANGVYTIVFINNATGNKLTARLLIAK